MCTLILGRDVLSPGSVLLAANRDEDPARPSDRPRVLRESPRLVGGHDRIAGGTWLAIREGRAVVALLNRRDRSGGPAPPAPDRRSRGLLTLEVAGMEEVRSETVPRGRHDLIASPNAGLGGPGPTGEPSLSLSACVGAQRAFRRDRYAPFTLVFASPESCWLMVHDGEARPAPPAVPIPPGWHVLTHADLDDVSEPRTAWLGRELAGFSPRSLEQAERRVDELLRAHGDATAGIPAVCLHAGRMVTVSTSSVWLAAGVARYRHAEGRPCEHPLVDHSHLLGISTPAEEER
jgi:hypothetical protein